MYLNFFFTLIMRSVILKYKTITSFFYNSFKIPFVPLSNTSLLFLCFLSVSKFFQLNRWLICCLYLVLKRWGLTDVVRLNVVLCKKNLDFYIGRCSLYSLLSSTMVDVDVILFAGLGVRKLCGWFIWRTIEAI